MDYKEKYDMALKRARNLYKDAIDMGENIRAKQCEIIFPELKESEDERIRKVLLNDFKNNCSEYYCEGVNRDMIIAWLERRGQTFTKKDIDDAYIKGVCDAKHELEKQGEQKPAEWHRQDEQNLNACLGYIPDEFLRRWLMDVIHVKYDKPADKIEPKFKVGDWIINEFSDICLITDIDLENGYYICESNRFGNTDGDIDLTDKAFHLWTIQDAKDGDVLSYRERQWCFIYKGIVTEDTFKYYALLSEKGITVNDAAFSLLSSCITPATKEQREQLLKAIANAGFMWDAEKKELKEIKDSCC